MRHIKIGFIGHLAIGKDYYDGQTIKTRTVYEGIYRVIDNIVYVDTNKKNSPLKLIIDTLKCLLFTNRIIVMLSRNGLKVYLPLLYLYSKLPGKKVFHCVIGGNDDELLNENPKWIHYMASFSANWYESKKLVEKMKNKGILSSEYLPNFKNIKRLDIKQLNFYVNDQKNSDTYKFCTFSRVTKEKGISDAVQALNSVIKSRGKNIYLDVYGPIDPNYEKEFFDLLTKYDFVKYRGVVEAQESVECLKGYYGLMFPTYFYGEGFPGTLIDAMCAGVPVIASDWHFNSEIINDGIDGIVYGTSKYEKLEDAIMWAIDNKENFINFKKKTWEKAENFLIEKNINYILNEMGFEDK